MIFLKFINRNKDKTKAFYNISQSLTEIKYFQQMKTLNFEWNLNIFEWKWYILVDKDKYVKIFDIFFYLRRKNLIDETLIMLYFIRML